MSDFRLVTSEQDEDQALPVSSPTLPSIDLLSNFFDQMLSGVAICRMSSREGGSNDFVYLYTNPAFHRQTGLADVIGKHVSEVIPGIQESDPLIFEIFGRVASSGVPEAFETYLAGLQEWFSVEVFCPQANHFAAIFNVVTKQKRDELQLIQLLAEQKAVINSRIVGIVKTRDRRIVWANPAFATMFGLDADEAIGLPTRIFFPSDQAYREFSEIAFPPIQRGEIFRGEIQLLRNDGTLAWYQISYGKLEFEGDELIASLVDVTERMAAEIALRNAWQESDDLYNNAANGYHSIGPDGTVLRINDTELEWLGYRRDEVIGRKNICELLTPDSVQIFRSNFPKFAEQGWLHDLQLEMVRKDGSILPILVTATAMKDQQGRLVMSRTTVYDLTEKLRIEGQLKEAQRIAQIGSWEVDLVSNTLTWSDEMFHIYGIPPPEVPSRETCRATIHPDDQDSTRQAFENSVQGKTCLEITHRVPTPGGGLKYVRVRGENYYAKDGTPQRSAGTAQDVTISVLQEMALKQSEERYRTVLEDQTEIISRLDADGRLIFVNDVYCRFFGKQVGELVGECWHPLAHPDDLAGIEERLGYLAPDHPVVLIENRVYSGNGDLRWMQFVNRGFFDSDGSLREIQAVGRDITDRKEAEIALRQAQEQLEKRVMERTEQVRQLAVHATLAEERERRTIARDLHDDLGQILNVSRIKLDTLAKTLPVEASRQLSELNGLIADASRMVRSLTSQLSPPMLSELGLGPTLCWLADEMERQYGLVVEVAADDSLSLPPVQSAILFRAARELLINVAKHSGSEIARVEFSRRDGWMLLVVEDSGIGIADPKAAFLGTSGFGLASIRERILFLGGDMELSNQFEGGLRIVLRLPPEPRPGVDEWQHA